MIVEWTVLEICLYKMMTGTGGSMLFVLVNEKSCNSFVKQASF